MSNMIIFKPLTIAAAAAVVPGSSTGVSNLLTPDPKEVWSGTAGAGVYEIDFDMGGAVTINAILVTGMWPGTSLFGLYSATAMGSGFAGVYLPAGPDNAAPHAFRHLSAPVTSRYWRGIFSGNPGNPVVGILALGLAFQPTHNREWGGGRTVIDTGTKERLRGGGFGIDEGVRKAGYRWVFGDLLDSEVDALWDLALDRGEGRPIVVVEDPADAPGLARRIHYGLFDAFEPYGRQNPGQTRWALSMEEWV
jgi:hypothetical protein